LINLLTLHDGEENILELGEKKNGMMLEKIIL